MTQDFAKTKRATQRRKTASSKSRSSSAQPRKNGHRKTANSNKAPAWAWLVIGLLLAALITLLIYLANQPKQDQSNTQTTTEAPKPTNNKPPQPRFDFYQILKEQEVEVPDRSGEIAAATPENLTYFLQAGSFKNKSDANELRAQLLLTNLEASIEAANSSGTTWHRVVVGPFKSRSKMAKARSILASKNLSPLLLKRKSD
ncbi:MAG: SPOR domain-containing protein [Cellvibrionaceae bacterium]